MRIRHLYLLCLYSTQILLTGNASGWTVRQDKPSLHTGRSTCATPYPYWSYPQIECVPEHSACARRARPSSSPQSYWLPSHA